MVLNTLGEDIQTQNFYIYKLLTKNMYFFPSVSKQAFLRGKITSKNTV